ncbi:MAG: tripartite tricarboxylate transporter substrate binding protein [Betaproteobacteria bacterium]|nr:tripartite tricarboxylate transporter substrate binding protein [Betaproteobacteria bacterium]
MRTQHAVVIICITLIAYSVTAIPAEERFPARPIRVIVPAPPGSSADLTSRALANMTSSALKQPIIIINRAGASGSVGLAELKNAESDGYTLGTLTAGGLINAILSKVTYHPLKDFDAIVHYMTVPEALVVNGDTSFTTLDDLLKYARERPGKVTFGSAGPSIALNMARLGAQANVQWVNVPYAGGAPVVIALLGGHITSAVLTPVFKPHVATGRLRLLGTFTVKRLEAYPDVPTLKELGYEVEGSGGIFGILGPRGIPKERIQIIHDALYTAMQTSQFKEVLAQFDATYDYRGPESFQRKIKELYESRIELVEKYGKVLR